MDETIKKITLLNTFTSKEINNFISKPPLPPLSNDVFWVTNSFLAMSSSQMNIAEVDLGGGGGGVTMVEFRGEN